MVGGDFFDFFMLDDNKYAVLMADISGKGIPAALFMGAARNIIRAQSKINNTPAALLKNSNDLIFQESEFGMFVTLFYAIVDPSNNLITYASAGHNNQILIKKKEKKAIKLQARGKPLGMFNDIEFTEKIVLYEPGDILLLFTDGVVELMGDDDLDIEIGEKKLSKKAFKMSDSDPWEIINHFKQELHTSTIKDEFKDDFTLFVIKF